MEDRHARAARLRVLGVDIPADVQARINTALKKGQHGDPAALGFLQGAEDALAGRSCPYRLCPQTSRLREAWLQGSMAANRAVCAGHRAPHVLQVPPGRESF